MEPEKERPWVVTRQSGECAYVGLGSGRSIAVFGGYGHQRAVSDAKRTVDCVNACRGLTMSEVRAALRELRLKKARRARMELRKAHRRSDEVLGRPEGAGLKGPSC